MGKVWRWRRVSQNPPEKCCKCLFQGPSLFLIFLFVDLAAGVPSLEQLHSRLGVFVLARAAEPSVPSRRRNDGPDDENWYYKHEYEHGYSKSLLFSSNSCFLMSPRA